MDKCCHLATEKENWNWCASLSWKTSITPWRIPPMQGTHMLFFQGSVLKCWSYFTSLTPLEVRGCRVNGDIIQPPLSALLSLVLILKQIVWFLEHWKKEYLPFLFVRKTIWAALERQGTLLFRTDELFWLTCQVVYLWCLLCFHYTALFAHLTEKTCQDLFLWYYSSSLTDSLSRRHKKTSKWH